METSRTKASSYNSIWALIKYSISIITAFTLKTLVIKVFGEVFSGLISLYSNIISILSISELGIGGALVYKLYKPLAENDNVKVKMYLKLYQRIYLAIGLIILVVGLIVTPFLGFITSGTQLTSGNIYIIFLIYLFNSCVTYISGHRRALLFAEQKTYKETIAQSISTLLTFPLQLIVLFSIKNLYIYLLTSTFLNITELAIIYLFTNSKYSEICKSETLKLDKGDKKELLKNSYAMSFNKLSSVIFNGIDSVIISICLGVSSVFLYSNYYLIYTYVITITNLIFYAIKSSVGNYAVSHTDAEKYQMFKNINLIFFGIISFCSCCLFVLYQPFMSLWGNIANSNMMLPLIIPILFSIYFFVDSHRVLIKTFKETTGHFWEDRYLPLICAIVNVILSFILAQFIGLTGIILATIISSIPGMIVETAVTFKKVFNISPKFYWVGYFVKFTICILSSLLAFYIVKLINLNGIIGLLVDLVICTTIQATTFIICFFKTPEFKFLLQKVKALCKLIKPKFHSS